MNKDKNWVADSPEIQGFAIVNVQGLPIRSALGRDVNDGIVSAMSAAILSVSERALKELARGDLRRIIIEGLEGIIILSKCGKNAILCTLCKADASLGRVFLDIQSICRKIAALLD